MNEKWKLVIPIVVFLVLMLPVMMGFKITNNYYADAKDRVAGYVKECDEGTSELSEDSCNKFREYKVTYKEYSNELNTNSIEKVYSHIFLVATPFIMTVLFVLPLMRDKKLKEKDYKNLMLKIIKNAYSISWVLPAICLIRGIATFIGVSRVNAISSFNLFYPLLDALLAFMFMGIIINIALIVARKLNNEIIYLVGGAACYSLIAFLIDRLGNLLVHWEMRSGEYLNIFALNFINIRYVSAFFNLFFMFVISGVVLYFGYRDSKKLIADCKNNA